MSTTQPAATTDRSGAVNASSSDLQTTTSVHLSAHVSQAGGAVAAPRLRGVDVSAYQGVPNWRQARASGIVWAAAKATEGLGYLDPSFPANWHGMKQAGVTRIAYHFLRPELDGSAQARFLHSYVRDHGHFTSGDGVMLDLEQADGATPGQILVCAEAFVSEARRLCGRNVVLYTGRYFWDDDMGNPQSAVLKTCPLWAASWGVLPAPWSPWSNISMWQYSAHGVVPGIPGEVDLDYFLGDRKQLAEVLR